MKKIIITLLILANCFYSFGQHTDLTPFIIKVSIKDGTTLFDGSQNFQDANLRSKFIFRQDTTEIPEIPSSQNTVLLLFTAAQDYNEFSYFLEGYDKEWSNWSIETAKQYLNLKSEKYYIFHVKTRNPKQEESREALFRFYINPPWYKTFWAYISYVFLIFLLFRMALSMFLNRKK